MDLDGDDEAEFDDLARRAGAALRRPAPADGVRVIAARQRRQQALKASVVGGVAVATLIGALVIIANRDDADSLPPVDSSPPTTPATTTPAPTPTAFPIVNPPTTAAPTTAGCPAPPSVPFEGTWQGDMDDGDGMAAQTMEIMPSGGDEYEVVVRNEAAVACAGGPSTVTGTGRLDGSRLDAGRLLSPS